LRKKLCTFPPLILISKIFLTAQCCFVLPLCQNIGEAKIDDNKRLTALIMIALNGYRCKVYIHFPIYYLK